MPYYPKSQIKTNQYSDGTLFVLTSGVVYTGYYYQTSDGRYFSGKNPQDLPQVELTATTNQNTVGAPYQRNPLFDSQFTEYDTTSLYQTFGEYDSSVYPKYNTNFFRPTPKYMSPKPTPEEYKIGEFRRYFLKKTNQIQYIEVDKTTFNSIVKKEPTYDWTLYYPFFLSWQLTGNKDQVAKTNQNITLLAMKNQRLPNLDEYLQFNWTKYYQ